LLSHVVTAPLPPQHRLTALLPYRRRRTISTLPTPSLPYHNTLLLPHHCHTIAAAPLSPHCRLRPAIAVPSSFRGYSLTIASWSLPHGHRHTVATSLSTAYHRRRTIVIAVTILLSYRRHSCHIMAVIVAIMIIAVTSSPYS